MRSAPQAPLAKFWASGIVREVGATIVSLARAQVMVLKWEGVTLQRGDPKVCEAGKGVYG